MVRILHPVLGERGRETAHAEVAGSEQSSCTATGGITVEAAGDGAGWPLEQPGGQLGGGGGEERAGQQRGQRELGSGEGVDGAFDDQDGRRGQAAGGHEEVAARLAGAGSHRLEGPPAGKLHKCSVRAERRAVVQEAALSDQLVGGHGCRYPAREQVALGAWHGDPDIAKPARPHIDFLTLAILHLQARGLCPRLCIRLDIVNVFYYACDMHDGPHKTLPLRGPWKKAFERAGTPAFSLREVGESLIQALASDCRKEVSPSLLLRIREAIESPNGHLFSESRSEEIKQLCGIGPMNVLEQALVDNLMARSANEPLTLVVLSESMIAALEERIECRKRQAEEHYCQRSPTEKSTTSCFKTIGSAASKIDLIALANQIIDDGKPLNTSARICDGIDDGVPLPSVPELTH